jgi:hypothetical protein
MPRHNSEPSTLTSLALSLNMCLCNSACIGVTVRLPIRNGECHRALGSNLLCAPQIRTPYLRASPFNAVAPFAIGDWLAFDRRIISVWLRFRPQLVLPARYPSCNDIIIGHSVGLTPGGSGGERGRSVPAPSELTCTVRPSVWDGFGIERQGCSLQLHLCEGAMRIRYYWRCD